MIQRKRTRVVVAAVLLLGVAGCASNQGAKAKEESRQAEGFFRLSQLDFSQGKNQDAIAHAKQALSKDPKNAEVHGFLGTVYLYLSDYDNAEKSLKEALKLNPYLTDARNTL